jgi:hypothetical protein
VPTGREMAYLHSAPKGGNDLQSGEQGQGADGAIRVLVEAIQVPRGRAEDPRKRSGGAKRRLVQFVEERLRGKEEIAGIAIFRSCVDDAQTGEGA